MSGKSNLSSLVNKKALENDPDYPDFGEIGADILQNHLRVGGSKRVSCSGTRCAPPLNEDEQAMIDMIIAKEGDYS